MDIQGIAVSIPIESLAIALIVIALVGVISLVVNAQGGSTKSTVRKTTRDIDRHVSSGRRGMDNLSDDYLEQLRRQVGKGDKSRR